MLPLGLAHARAHRVTGHRNTMLGLFFGALVVAGVFTLWPGRVMLMSSSGRELLDPDHIAVNGDPGRSRLNQEPTLGPLMSHYCAADASAVISPRHDT
jgi:hypothetical protein